jgi:hypothetical protein
MAYVWFPPYERLFYAIQSNRVPAIRAALLTGSSPDGCDYSASSSFGEPVPPLVSAIWQNNAASVQALLEAGANPNVTYADDDTPLELALRKSSPEVVRLLLEHGADAMARGGARATTDVVPLDGRPPVVAIVDSTDPTWRTKESHPVPLSCVYHLPAISELPSQPATLNGRLADRGRSPHSPPTRVSDVVGFF